MSRQNERRNPHDHYSLVKIHINPHGLQFKTQCVGAAGECGLTGCMPAGVEAMSQMREGGEMSSQCKYAGTCGEGVSLIPQRYWGGVKIAVVRKINEQ